MSIFRLYTMKLIVTKILKEKHKYLINASKTVAYICILLYLSVTIFSFYILWIYDTKKKKLGRECQTQLLQLGLLQPLPYSFPEYFHFLLCFSLFSKKKYLVVLSTVTIERRKNIAEKIYILEKYIYILIGCAVDHVELAIANAALAAGPFHLLATFPTLIRDPDAQRTVEIEDVGTSTAMMERCGTSGRFGPGPWAQEAPSLRIRMSVWLEPPCCGHSAAWHH